MEVEGKGLVSATEKVWAENNAEETESRRNYNMEFLRRNRSATNMKKCSPEAEVEEEEEVVHHYSAPDSNYWAPTDMQFDEVHNNIILYIYIVYTLHILIYIHYIVYTGI
jgi:hypothetical protein